MAGSRSRKLSLATVCCFAISAATESGAETNRRPMGSLLVRSSRTDALKVRAAARVGDPEDDRITTYVFDWGDGQRTETKRNAAKHTYATPGSYVVNVCFSDARGASGSARAYAGYALEPTTVGKHTVRVGDRITIDVTLRNTGLVPVLAGHSYGYKPGTAPVPGTVQLASHPAFDQRIEIAPGETVEARYVFEALAPGAFTFTGIGIADPVGCPVCPRIRAGADHSIVIHDGAPPPSKSGAI